MTSAEASLAIFQTILLAVLCKALLAWLRERAFKYCLTFIRIVTFQQRFQQLLLLSHIDKGVT